MSAFAGSWEQAEAKNMEPYMDVLGVPEDQRKLSKEYLNKIQVTVDGDSWHYVSNYGDHENRVTLKLGTEVEYKTHTGVAMKGILKSVEDKVVEEHFYGDQKVDVVREIVDGKMVVTFTAKGVTAQIFYAKK